MSKPTTIQEVHELNQKVSSQNEEIAKLKKELLTTEALLSAINLLLQLRDKEKNDRLSVGK